jgi:AAA domain
MGMTETTSVTDEQPRTPTTGRWLWPNVIPRRSVTVLDGDPDVGKSLITIDLAARMTRGASWPDGSAGCGPARVLMLCGEDCRDDTIIPRLIAAGGDAGRVTVMGTPDDPSDPILLPGDARRLEAIVRRLLPGLVVIDPLSIFASNLGGGRQAMTALVRLAATLDTSVVLNRHLIKDPKGRAIHRGLGSVGIIGAARAGFLAAIDPFDPSRWVLAPTKANLAAPPPALAYRICGRNGQAVIEWLGPTTVTAEDAVRGPRRRERPGELVAAQFLVEELGKGEQPAAELLKRALALGISERTLERAKAALRVESRQVRIGDKRVWAWSLTNYAGQRIDLKSLPELNEEEDFDDDW